jgi:hypothetical protein
MRVHCPQTGASLLALTFALVGCGGDSGTGIDNGNGNGGGGGGGGGGRVIKADPSFASDIQEIFARKGCADASCHGSMQEAELDLRAGNSYAHLVSVPSTQTGILRVIPGDADGSYVVMKVEGRAAVGDRMPLGGIPLDNIDLTNLKNWINEGAKNN